MYLPTSLPVATECALRGRSDRLLTACFAVSIGVHVVLGLALMRLRTAPPEPPPTRMTEVRLVKRLRVTPPVLLRPRSSVASRPVARPRDLSLYLAARAEEGRKSRRRRSRRRPAVTPPVMAALPTPGAQTEAPTPAPPATGGERPRGEASRPSETPSAPSAGAAEEPRPVQVARRSASLPLPAPANPRRAPEPLSSPGTPLEREPVAARGEARRGEGPPPRLPEMPPGEDSAPRVLTSGEREAGGVPDAAPVSRAGERPRRRAGDSEVALSPGRPDAAPAATEAAGSDLPDPAKMAVSGAEEAPAPRAERDSAGRPEGGGEQPDGSARSRRIAELPPAATPDGGTESGGRGNERGGKAPVGAAGDDEDGTPRRFARGSRRGADEPGAGNGAGDGGSGRDEGDHPGGGRGAGVLPGEGGPGDGGGERGRGGDALERFDGGGLAGKGTPGGVYVSTTGRYLLPGAVTGSDYMFHVNALGRMLDEINSRTKLQVRLGRQYLRIQPGGFRRAPVVVFTGHRAFTLNDEQRLALRQYVEGGGMLWADLSGDAFDESFRDEMERIFGKRPTALSSGHTLYRSFYVLDGVPAGDLGGRAAFEGVTLGDRLAVVITPNRYFAAVGGPPRVTEAVQEGALRVAVNIYVYAAAHYRAETE